MRGFGVVVVGVVMAVGVGACVKGGAGARASAGASADAAAESGTGTGTGTGTGESEKSAGPGMEAHTLGRVCGLAVGVPGRARAGVKAFSRDEGSCAGNFCDVADVPPKGADACFVATSNLARAERESNGSRGRAAPQSRPWDKKSAPRYFDRVDAHLHLDGVEHELLTKNGFVVLDRLRYDSYAVAFHDVFQQQLPVYVGVDAIFNAVYQASQTILGEVERTRLGPKLVSMLDRMRATLRAAPARYDADTATDLDLYLVVAHRLLHPSSAARARTPEAEALAGALVGQITAGAGLEEIDLFGRARIVDFSQYVPRGHYANAGYEDGFEVKLTRPVDGSSTEHISPREYFLAMTWLSRLELNLVSRSCRSSQPGADVDPSETPREARDAIALADLVARAGAADDLRAFEDVYAVFAGGREDVPLLAIAALAAKGGFGPRDPEAPARLRAAIGAGWKRTARTHFMPDGAGELPAIATMFGPRIVPDIAPLTHLVHPSVPGRMSMGAADVAYVLGHDRAKSYLTADLATYPGLSAALDASRADLATGALGKHDVYSAWIGAALKLGDRPSGATPSFMRTDAFADLRMSSALAVYAQIRHTFVLLAGQGYDGYGCEIPDGWVEPVVPVYDGMLAWVRAARSAAPSQAAYFRRAEEVLGMLRSIASTELAGAALSEPQRRWLGMVSEYTPKDGYGDSGEPPKYTGWYFDLFPDRDIGAQRQVGLVADWFTLTNADQVRHLGIENAAMGVFVVDVGGEPRAMVGPVVKTYEVATSIAGRLDDETARTAPGKRAEWLSFLAPVPEAPPIAARLFVCDDDARVVLRAGRAMNVTVTLLDHHGDALGEARTASAGPTDEPSVLAFALPKDVLASPHGIEGVHLHASWSDASRAHESWDFVTGGSVFRGETATLPGVSGSRFDVAFGAFAPPTSSSPSR